MAYIIMLIVTIICLVLIIYNLVKDGPIINVFLMAVTIDHFIFKTLFMDKSILERCTKTFF